MFPVDRRPHGWCAKGRGCRVELGCPTSDSLVAMGRHSNFVLRVPGSHQGFKTRWVIWFASYKDHMAAVGWEDCMGAMEDARRPGGLSWRKGLPHPVPPPLYFRSGTTEPVFTALAVTTPTRSSWPHSENSRITPTCPFTSEGTKIQRGMLLPNCYLFFILNSNLLMK